MPKKTNLLFMNLLSYNISPVLPDITGVDRMIINTINPHSYCVAETDTIFKDALKESDYLLPDGVGIVFASYILSGKKIKRITGSDLHLYMLNEAQKHKLKVFYLGSAPKTLEKISKRVSREFNKVRIETLSPPYKPEFGKEDTELMIEYINNFAPDILFVGMTAPKQEKWVYENQSKLNARIICSIGAVFDFYAGTVKRPQVFWQNIGLEWLPRFIKEPKRLFRRNFISTPRFLFHVLKHKMNLK